MKMLKSLKAKLFLMVSIPIISLVVVAAITYSTSMGNIQRTEELGEFAPLMATAGKIKASSHGIPRYMWLSLAYEGNLEKRRSFMKKVSGEFDTIKLNVKNLQTILAKDIAELQLKPEVAKHTEEIATLLVSLAEVVERVEAKLNVGDAENDRVVKKILLEDMPPIALKISESVEALNEGLESDAHEFISMAKSKATQSMYLRVGIVMFTVLLSMAFSGVITTRVTRGLLNVTTQVSGSTQQVAAASHQIANASQQLASVSQTQASAIEETSAALAEMSGMVEKNTRNAESTAQLAQSVRGHAEKSVGSMGELIQSMQEILESNKKIENLVKVIEEIGEKTSVIDEIVFQTKLLSFNASVEAERAGEHGRGFAVVAQEVGNLAQMSGRSALEISSIVKTSVKEAIHIAQENREKVERGNKLVEITEKVLREVEESAKSVLELSSQVLNASKEQNTGINQINTSVDNINKTTQETAATAEEAAGAAEELNSQSATLQTMVQSLNEIVTGNETVESDRKAASNVTSLPDRKLASVGAGLKLAVGGTGSELNSWEKL